jgi:hypothetical protein
MQMPLHPSSHIPGTSVADEEVVLVVHRPCPCARRSGSWRLYVVQSHGTCHVVFRGWRAMHTTQCSHRGERARIARRGRCRPRRGGVTDPVYRIGGCHERRQSERSTRVTNWRTLIRPGPHSLTCGLVAALAHEPPVQALRLAGPLCPNERSSVWLGPCHECSAKVVAGPRNQFYVPNREAAALASAHPQT